MQPATLINDQPISATFFGEGKWLTDFITPNALEVQELHKSLTQNMDSLENKLAVLREWVSSQVTYKRFIRGKIWVEGKTSVQDDLWNLPSVTSRIRVGNCANMSFLLASLARNEMPSSKVYCVLGNLYNGKPGGHAWVQAQFNGNDYIMEATRPDVPPFIPASIADRYEAVHLFNDERTYAIEGRTIMEPMTECYSTWLKDYLDWAYVEGRK